jgi:hypothetical protein
VAALTQHSRQQQQKKFYDNCRRGPVYHGIYFPSLSAKLQDERLEVAYLKYAHRQRQKSLMLVS